MAKFFFGAISARKVVNVSKGHKESRCKRKWWIVLPEVGKRGGRTEG